MENSSPFTTWHVKEAVFKEDRLLIGGHQVMMAWEAPYMHRLVSQLLSHTSGDILEIGFGMGIAATEIQRLGVNSHTIIEPHPDVWARALAWKTARASSEITVVQDYWQNLTARGMKYDGIFFDTYFPSNRPEDVDRYRFQFIQAASEIFLKPGGALTLYYIRPCLEPACQEQLLRYFSRIVLERMEIFPPADCEYTDLRYAPCLLAIK